MKIYFNTNNIARIIIAGVTFLNLPVTMFMRTYVIIPRRIPFEIE